MIWDRAPAAQVAAGHADGGDWNIYGPHGGAYGGGDALYTECIRVWTIVHHDGVDAAVSEVARSVQLGGRAAVAVRLVVQSEAGAASSAAIDRRHVTPRLFARVVTGEVAGEASAPDGSEMRELRLTPAADESADGGPLLLRPFADFTDDLVRLCAAICQTLFL